MQSTPEHSEQRSDEPPAGEDRRQLLPVPVVEDRTGISRWTIYRRIRSGKWPSGRSGRQHLIPRAFVDGLVAEIEAGRQVNAEDYAAQVWLAKTNEDAA